MSTNVASVTSHFPDAENGFTTTTAGSVGSGAATVTLNSVGGYTNGQPAVFVIDPTDSSKKQTFTGIVDTAGVQITSVVWTAGTNQTHALGATVVDYATATHIAMISKGLQVEHHQDGTHHAVTADSLVATGAVQGATVTSTGDLKIRSIGLETIKAETQFDFVASGCVWSADAAGTTLAGSMTAGVVYIDGIRTVVSSITAHAFTASKDTYIDVGLNGTVDYTEAANNAASPALSASHIRLGIIVTDGTDIHAVGSINQGQETKILPIASSIPYQVTDSLGNLICPRDPQRRILGSRQVTANNITGTTIAAITGLSVPVIIPTGRKAKISFSGSMANGAAASNTVTLWDGAISGTQLSGAVAYVATATGSVDLTHFAVCTLSAGLHTINAACAANSNTWTTSSPPYTLLVELV